MNKELEGYKNKLKYIKEYNKKNFKTISFCLHKTDDADIIEWIKKIPNKSQWLREIVKKEMK